MSKLFDESDSEGEANFKTRNPFAENYNAWRQKEELNKFKTKYGQDILDENEFSSSSSDDEDDDAVHLTEETEKQFFKTLASLKTKDPKIYDDKVEFFTSTSDAVTKKSKIKEEPMFIKDYERKMILENNFDDESDDIKPTTYVEEQENLKKGLKDALHRINESDDDEEWGGMFTTRKKTKAELKKETEEYKEWLKGHKEDVNEDIKKDLKSLKEYWNDPSLDKDEKFLRDYILDKRFMEAEDDNYIPTYDEIIHDSDQGLSEDEEQIEKQEEFEHKYNYRFEEPDEEFIKRYPRTIESSVRRKDDRRKIKRAEIKERKVKEKKQKMEEIKEMQSFKKKEIEEKIKKLKEITGNVEIAFDDADIDGDFDPEAHDKKMQKIFDEEYYNGPEGDQKPEFPDIDEELELENWDKPESTENYEDASQDIHCEDDDFNMDCDYDPETVQSLKESKTKRRKKRKTKFAEIINEPKPIFNADDKTYQQYLDEYYKLECEDVIGDLPCRFKYRKVLPNSFGLTIEEILMANDRELNKWCSLKKAIQYRPQHVENYDLTAFERKGKNESLKRKILPSLFKEEEIISSANNDVISTSKTNKKRIYETSANKNGSPETTTLLVPQKEPSAKRAKSNRNSVDVNITQTSKKSSNLKNSKKKKKGESSTDTETPLTTNNKTVIDGSDGLISKKVNKKRSSTIFQVENYDDAVTITEKEKVTPSHNRMNKKRKAYSSTNEVKKNKFIKKDALGEFDISDARLKAFGLKPKKFKNKIKYGGNKSKKVK